MPNLPEPWTGRKGRFKIAASIIEEYPEVVQRLLAQTIVLRVDYDPLDDAFEFYAYCLAFEQLKEGWQVPEYDVAYDQETEATTWTKKGK